MNKIEHGVILAAGNGTRLYPLTKFFPKLVLPIYDKPLICHHFDLMKLAGVQKVCIVVSPKTIEVVNQILNQESFEGIKYEFVIQRHLGGTGHALLMAKDFLNYHPFMFLLGDEYYRDIRSFSRISNPESESNMLGIVEYQNIEHIKSGCNAVIKGQQIQNLVEKPGEHEISGSWCWDGSAIFDHELIETLERMDYEAATKEKEYLCIVAAMQKMLLQNIKIGHFKKETTNINITNITDYFRANIVEYLKNNDERELYSLIKECSNSELSTCNSIQ